MCLSYFPVCRKKEIAHIFIGYQCLVFREFPVFSGAGNTLEPQIRLIDQDYLVKMISGFAGFFMGVNNH